MQNQVRAFACGPLIAGLMLAAASRPTHAQTLDTVVGERVAAVTRQASRAGQPARRFDLTLDDAVERALERNLDIAVQRIHPLVQDMRVAAAGAAFLPVASSGFDFNQETAPNRFVFDGGGLRGQPIVSDRGTHDLGVGQQVKWGGGRYDVTWDSTRSESTNMRVEVGTMAPIDVVQAQSEAAARRQLLALAVETQRTSELALKELIVGGTSDELWNAEINPTDEPRIEAAPIDLQAAIRGALDRRTDVSRARRQLDVNEATVENLRNSTLPALDLVGSYQLTGQGGPRLVPAGNSFEDIFGGAGGVIPGGYREALDSIANADYPVWSVQLQMSYPLGRSADRAAYERARLELRQNRTQIRRIELRIASKVTNAALRIESIRERIEAATASRELAERQLEAEESKFEVGLSTNFFVLQSQRDLANAQDAELRAILDYQRALIEFDRTQRASLGAAGIAVVGGAMGGGAGPTY